MENKNKYNGSHPKHRKRVKYSEEQLQNMMERATIKVSEITNKDNEGNGTEETGID